MKTKRHWKNLAVVAVMGLAIAVQSVMPVNAALVCGKCGQKITTRILPRTWESKVRCTEPGHVSCYIVTTYYQNIAISSCPQGADDGHYYFVDETVEPWAGESRHRVIVR